MAPDGWQGFSLSPCARSEAALKHAARAAVSEADELPPGPVGLQIALTVSSADGWAQTWKPLIDGLEPLLGWPGASRAGIPRTDGSSA